MGVVSRNERINLVNDNTHSVDIIKILKVLHLLTDKFMDYTRRIVSNIVVLLKDGTCVWRLISLGGSALITSGGTFSGQPVSAERGATSSSTVMSTVKLP